ncbi:MAG: hypothetical protein F4049_13390 [Gemmatimonadetes bacterium]|nr:hypothetical protein [Gemmatimonadota bacterium]MYK41200.1 hypothetical protein [Gemmatimonadota bacterium]
MIRPSNNTLLVDSGFFFALFDPRDQHHGDAFKKQDWLEALSVVVPWPILYETINTRFIRRPETIVRFESILRAQDTVFIDDSPYRLDAYEDVLARAKTQRNAMSLVDAVLCAILADPNVRIDAMLTFNSSDFGYICNVQKVELL